MYVKSYNDLRQFGFDYLTGEACNIMLRGLWDVTQKGKEIFCHAFGLPNNIAFAQPYNTGNPKDPSVGSVFISKESLHQIIVIAMFHCGAKEVVKFGEEYHGFTANDLKDDAIGKYPEEYEKLAKLRKQSNPKFEFHIWKEQGDQPHVGTSNTHAFTGITHI